jgi:hypothetical protein
MRRVFHAPHLGFHQWDCQLPRHPRDDFVLQVEEIGYRLVEAIRPKMLSGLRVDQPHIDAHAVAAALHRAFEHIPYTQLAADLAHIVRSAFIEEGAATEFNRTAFRARRWRNTLQAYHIFALSFMGQIARVCFSPL